MNAWTSVLVAFMDSERTTDYGLWLHHTTKTAKIKKVILLVSTLTIWRCAAK